MVPHSFAAAFVHTQHNLNFFFTLILTAYFKVRETFSYPLVLQTSSILNLVAQNPRVLVQNVSILKNNWVFNDLLLIHLILC